MDIYHRPLPAIPFPVISHASNTSTSGSITASYASTPATGFGTGAGVSLCGNDGTMQVGADCRDLDFTLKFEYTILSLLPNLLFITFLLSLLLTRLTRALRPTLISPFPSPLNLVKQLSQHLARASILREKWDPLLVYKVIVGGYLVAVDVGVGVLIGTAGSGVVNVGGMGVGAGVTNILSSITLLAASLAYHHLSPTPPLLTPLFALWRALVFGVMFRTYSLIFNGLNGNGVGVELRALYVLMGLGVAAAGGMVVGEVGGKRRWMKDEYRDLPRRTHISPYLRPFFLHLIPLLHLGGRRKLLLSDLEDVPPHLLAEPAMARMEEALNDLMRGRGRDGGGEATKGLLWATFRAFGRDMGRPVGPRVVLMLAVFSQVFLVQDMTRFVSDPASSDNKGWTLVGGFVFIYTIIPITTYLYWESVFNVSVQYRSALVGSIYSKTLRLASARKVGQGAAATYMSVDVERITESLSTVHEVWVAIVSIGIAAALLWFQAGFAMFAPLGVIFSLLTATSFFSGPSGRAQRAWMSSIDERIKLLSSMFNQIVPIKLGAYEKVFLEKAARLRANDVKALRKFYAIVFSAATLSNVGSTFAGFACLGTYALLHAKGVRGSEGPLDVTRIFTILTILRLLSQPINIIGQSLPSIAAAFASLKRIATFLVMDEKAGTNAVTGEVEDDFEPSSATINSDMEMDVRGAIDSIEPPIEANIHIVDGTFGWEGDLAVLRDINLDIRPGRLNMLIGPVASGKSTLLMSMLGETIKLRGESTLEARRVAYASQTAFIFPGTLRSNIVFDKPYDPLRLAKVIQACGLRQDMDRLPEGESTMLGERGTTLSGGQRQRIALARAVYSDPDLLLLDDPLSALDGETEDHVFQSLFGSRGLLRGKTVVLVTHAIPRLLAADHIIVMEHGRITIQGSYDDLEERLGRGGIRDTGAMLRQITSDKRMEEVEEKKPVQAEKPDEDEEGDIEESNWSAYGFYFRQIGLFVSVMSILVLATNNISTISIQGFLQRFAQANEYTAGWWIGYGAFCVGIIVFQTITLSYWTVFTIPTSCIQTHQTELEGVLHADFALLQTTAAGKLLNRFSQDIQQNDFQFPLAILNFVSAAIALIAVLVFFVMATPWLALALPILAPVYWFILRFYLKTSKQLQHLEAGSKSPLYTLFSTTVAGLVTIRAYKSEKFFSSKNTNTLNRSQGPFFFRFEGQCFLRVILAWMTSVLAIGMGVIAVALRHKTNAAFLGVALSQMTGLAENLSHALSSYADIENGAVSIKRIQQFAELPREEPLGQKAAAKVGSAQNAVWPAEGAITFKEYSMSYSAELPPALKHLSFDLQGGQKLGICGRSGSGKSTMLLALFRATKHSSGQILIDGVDLAKKGLEELRGSMSIVTQEPFLWHGSVRENIDVEGTRSSDEIWQALEDVGLRDAILSLPDGLDNAIDDEESFSKGQRQLLCLARAILAGKKIVVLDECTSSMDHESDKRIQDIVATKMGQFTVLAIAHRISSIVEYDQILLLDAGVLTEFAPPQELLSDPGSRFSRLAATQGIYGKPEYY